jgi:hypothetical protein
MTPWIAITALGDSALLLPTIAWMALVLARAPERRRDAFRWLVAAISCGGGVMLSKLLFMAWGIRPPGLDFTGLSGHTALAILVWPALGALLTRARQPAVRAAAVGLGALPGLAVAVSRLVLEYHSESEVWLGAVFGAAVLWWFLHGLFRRPARASPSVRWEAALLGGGALAILLLCHGRVFPSQHLLQDIAVWLSGHAEAFTRSARPG